MCGGSAGGHLSLMQAVAATPADPKNADPINRVSSKVQAAVAFFPPTDFLNYGENGTVALGEGTLSAFAAPFDFHEFNSESHRFERIVDGQKRIDIGRTISPIYSVDAGDPPILIIHGDADTHAS